MILKHLVFFLIKSLHMVFNIKPQNIIGEIYTNNIYI